MDFQIGNIICAVMYVVAAMFYYNIFLKTREIGKVEFMCCFLLAAALNVGKLYLNLSPEINLILSVCFYIGVSFVFYTSSIKNHIFAAIIFIIIGMLSENMAQYLLKFILGISYNDVSISTQNLFAPLSMAINIIILFYIKKIHHKQIANIPLKYIIPIMLVPMVSIAIILIVDKIIAISDGEGETLIIPLVLMLLYVSFIMFDFIESYSNKIKLEAAKEIIEKDKENYKILENNERELRDLRHDIRQHMQVIRTLKSVRTDNANLDIDGYVEDLQNAVNKITSVSYTGNEILDSILNIKGRRAKILNIRYFVKSNISADILINDMDISTILCNAIDNAIEGAVDTEEASIVIYIETESEYVRFLIENTANEVNFVDGVIETTKKDKRNHGRGIHNIKMCVQKYKGTAKFDYDEGVFVLDIKMLNQKL